MAFDIKFILFPFAAAIFPYTTAYAFMAIQAMTACWRPSLDRTSSQSWDDHPQGIEWLRLGRA
jgi:hypothetical protein